MNDGPSTEELRRIARAAGCRVSAVHRLEDGTLAHDLECRTHAAKVALLDALATWDARQPDVRRAAEMAAAGARTSLEQIAALHRLVRDGVLYTDEPIETFSPPMRVLRVGIGDCDDQARLLLALLRSLGHSARPATLGSPPTHVGAQVQLGGVWYWLETTIAAEPGEHPLAAAHRLGIETREDIA
jgi:transglutaminase-like putative cysteine protease